jgi:hypothetical protein
VAADLGSYQGMSNARGMLLVTPAASSFVLPACCSDFGLTGTRVVALCDSSSHLQCCSWQDMQDTSLPRLGGGGAGNAVATV